VDVKVESKIISSTEVQGGQQELTLSNGKKLLADLYLPMFGVIPNSSYVPTKFLDADGFVKVDEYFQVKGTENVWAIGDISDLEATQFANVASQAAHFAKNITLKLSNKTPLPYKAVPLSRMLSSI
jgi:NADH dehydrogenase FAD-containing subunit